MGIQPSTCLPELHSPTEGGDSLLGAVSQVGGGRARGTQGTSMGGYH